MNVANIKYWWGIKQYLLRNLNFGYIDQKIKTKWKEEQGNGDKL